MSRSYKHTPRSGDKKDKYLKNYANRRLRRYPINKPGKHSFFLVFIISL